MNAAKRLLKFLQQRFGLFAGEGVRSSPSIPTRVAVVGPEAHQSFDEGSEMLVESMDDGRVEVLDEGKARGEGSGPAGGFNLMQLELSEEDQPMVVPYEEVAIVLGSSRMRRRRQAIQSIFFQFLFFFPGYIYFV